SAAAIGGPRAHRSGCGRDPGREGEFAGHPGLGALVRAAWEESLLIDQAIMRSSGFEADLSRQAWDSARSIPRHARGPGDSADPVLLELAVERPLTDAEEPGGFLAVAGGQLEGLGNVVLLDRFQRLADQGVDAGVSLAPTGRCRLLEIFRQVVDV